MELVTLLKKLEEWHLVFSSHLEQLQSAAVLREYSNITVRIGAIESCISSALALMLSSGPAALWVLRFHYDYLYKIVVDYSYMHMQVVICFPSWDIQFLLQMIKISISKYICDCLYENPPCMFACKIRPIFQSLKSQLCNYSMECYKFT